ncbi:MAG: tRNA-dihydrouridine synthase family protein [Paludibacter sp.]|nr:tRNA-dihydrouridine synthase family protein [Paludibacter sp.]
MQLYLAPLQGLTDWIFRESYSQHIGQFDKTFTPFVRVQGGEFYRPSQCKDLLPEHNTFQKPVPQFLGNDAESFKRFEELCVEHGYPEANINMGCPYPMVTGKRMGAGLLAQPTEVATLLEGVFADTKLKISVKCRLGMESTEEFKELIPVFNSFPLEEIIIHPRVGKQQYKGEADVEAFARYAKQLKHPVCYNGDILTVADVERIRELAPQVDRIMIGRGILRNPFLLAELRQQELTIKDKVNMLRGFHTAIIEHCKQKYSGDLHFLKRLEEMWEYHAEAFENGHKIYKLVKKSKTLDQYEAVIFKAINELG